MSTVVDPCNKTNEPGLTGDELEVAKEDVAHKIALEKARVFGNIKFIGELYKVSLVSFKIINICMDTQLVKVVAAWRGPQKTPIDEKTLESACRLLQAAGKIVDATPKYQPYVSRRPP